MSQSNVKSMFVIRNIVDSSCDIKASTFSRTSSLRADNI